MALFENMSFYLPVGIPDRKDYIEKILSQGGQVFCSNKMNTERTIHLFPQDKLLLLPHSLTSVSLEYILDSTTAKKKLNPRDYTSLEIQKRLQKNSTNHSTGHGKRTRTFFSPRDDAAMLEFIFRQTKIHGKSLCVNSLKFWKWAQMMDITSHSADSMRNRYRTVLKNLTREQKRKLMEDHRKGTVQEPAHELAKTTSATEDEEQPSSEGTGLKKTEPAASPPPGPSLIEQQVSPHRSKHHQALNSPVAQEKHNNSPPQVFTKVEDVFNYLKVQTGQPLDVCIHAFYALSGHLGQTKDFLDGQLPTTELWTEEEDVTFEAWSSLRTYSSLQKTYEKSRFFLASSRKRRRSWHHVLCRFKFLYPAHPIHLQQSM